MSPPASGPGAHRREPGSFALWIVVVLVMNLTARADSQTLQGAALRDLTWKTSPEGLIFRIDFDAPVTPRIQDQLAHKQYYYIDFYGVTRPVANAAWNFAEAGLIHVKQLYYSRSKVLRLIFYGRLPALSHMEFEKSGDTYFLTVRPLRLKPLARAKSATGASTKKLVLIDPGHGGKSAGARTSRPVNGRHYDEKDLAMDIAYRLVPLIEASPNLDYRISRAGDNYVDLEDRIDLANRIEADLFISIHLNGQDGSKHSARGFEVYYLSDGTKLADRQLEDLENDMGIRTNTNGAQGRKIKAILANLTDDNARRRRQESFQLGCYVHGLFEIAGPFKSYCRGIKPANFRVLQNYNMPSVLVECGFLDNPLDAELVTQPKVQAEIASLLFNAINLYFARTDPSFEGYLAPVQ